LSLRICYIGAGSFSNRFIYPQLPRHDVELAAVCDLVEQKARAAAGTFGFRNVYTDFERMLDAEQPEAVFCVGRQDMQHEVGLRVLERGLPVYMQKPAAQTAAQVREMAATAARTGALCHVGFNLRSSPAVRKTKELLAGGEFGPPTLMIFRYGLMVNPVWHRAIADQHVHAVDTILHLLGDSTARGYVAGIRMQSGASVALCTTSEQDPDFEFLYY